MQTDWQTDREMVYQAKTIFFGGHIGHILQRGAGQACEMLRPLILYTKSRLIGKGGVKNIKSKTIISSHDIFLPLKLMLDYSKIVSVRLCCCNRTLIYIQALPC